MLPTVVACSGHCLLPVLGTGDTRLAVRKDSKKNKLVPSGKGWFDNALHDPPVLAPEPLLVTLLPLKHQGPLTQLTPPRVSRSGQLNDFTDGQTLIP